MRSGRAVAVRLAGLGLGLAGLGLAGCEPGTATPSGAPSASASGSVAGPGSPSGSSAACAVGSWRTTGFDGQAGQGGASARLTGGSGVGLRVAPSGATTVDFTGMQPMTVDGRAAGTDVHGSISYGGQVTGVVALPRGAVDSGSWQPSGTPDFHAVTVTADVQRPVQARIAENLPIGRYVSNQLAGVDTQPVLRSGTFACSGDTLRLTMTQEPITGTWTLRRA